MRADGRVYLLTFHGTLLGVDANRQLLCHRALDRPGPPLAVPSGSAAALIGNVFAAGPGIPAALAGLGFVPGLRPGTVALQRFGQFATAARDGGIAVFVTQCMGWESFLPITAGDLARLRDLLANRWTIPAGAAEITPEQISLGPNFTLRFGPVEIDLIQTLPFSPETTADRISLTPRDPSHPPVIAVRIADTPLPPSPPPAPKIWINALGNTGNRALQYLAAEGIRRLVPGATIENILLPEWGISAPAPRPPPTIAAFTGDMRFSIDVPGLADCLRRAVVETVAIESYTFHLDHYPPRAEARRLLGPTVGGDGVQGFGPHQLVCSIRGREILTAQHGDYLPLPIGYYRMLIAHSGLEPVFFGQIGDDDYAAALRRQFPGAQFVAGRGAEHDFEVLRRSTNIALSISSFAWLAAWLSEAERIFLPVAGMFSPVQHPDSLFLPLGEPAYEYILLPFAKSIDLFKEPEAFWRQQDVLAAAAKFVDEPALRLILANAGRLGKGRIYAAGFDPAYYLANNADVAATVAAGAQTALNHWLCGGGKEGRRPMEFDPKFYLRGYPDAAMALAEGRYPDALTYHQAVGHAAGHRPVP
jgi:hypothetical protein